MGNYKMIMVMLNFMVDYLLLLGANRLCSHSPGGLRAAAASAIGAAHVWLCLLPGFTFLRGWVWRVVFLALMALVAFGMHRSAVPRAAIFGLLQLAVTGITAWDSFWTVTLAALVIFLLCMAGKTGPGKQFVPVKITQSGKTVELMALLDTGNTLQDPVSGKQVLIADAGTAARLLGLTEAELARPIDTLASGKWKGLRLIPYCAIGQPRGMLLGLKVDSLAVNGKASDSIVAFAPQIIGEGKTFQALAGGTL